MPFVMRRASWFAFAVCLLMLLWLRRAVGLLQLLRTLESDFDWYVQHKSCLCVGVQMSSFWGPLAAFATAAEEGTVVLAESVWAALSLP